MKMKQYRILKLVGLGTLLIAVIFALSHIFLILTGATINLFPVYFPLIWIGLLANISSHVLRNHEERIKKIENQKDL